VGEERLIVFKVFCVFLNFKLTFTELLYIEEMYSKFPHKKVVGEALASTQWVLVIFLGKAQKVFETLWQC
jgi:hypothetical protein